MAEKKQIIHQLNRLEGQVKALKKMYKNERKCLDIIQQITAAKSALN
ncbi:MAG: metal-sensitive transcriptional regulator [Minisyncoccales bacterium]